MELAGSCGFASDVAVSMRLILGVLLIFAGIFKISDRPSVELITTIAPVITPTLAAIGIRLVSLVEILLGLSLITGLYLTIGLVATFILFTAFTAFIIVAINRKYSIACSCFGHFDNHSLAKTQIGRNLILIIATLLVLIISLSDHCSRLPAWEYPISVLGISTLSFCAILFVYRVTVAIEASFRNSPYHNV